MTVERLKQIELGSDGLDWVASSLRRGHTLAPLVLERIARERYSLFTLLPSGTSRSRAVAFSVGGLISGSVLDARLSSLMSQLAEDDCMLVVEDDLARPWDPAVLAHPENVLVFGTHVSRWAPIDQRSAAAAMKLLRQGASGYPTNAFVVAIRDGEYRLSSFPNLSGADLRSLAAAVHAVLVAAYDAEGFVVLEFIDEDEDAVSGP